jgi:D-2-hydroxyacid dehydrogenase (NADP+)
MCAGVESAIHADKPIKRMPIVVSLVRLSSKETMAIRNIDNSIELFEAGGWFVGEYRESWPPVTVDRYVSGDGVGTRAERDDLLCRADIIIAGFPFPLDLCARSPRLKWMHQTPAGASNLRRGDLWDSEVIVTTSRGYGETTAIAEYTIAGFLHFGKGFDRAIVDRDRGFFDRSIYGVRSVEKKTLCVVGAGGIGREVARLGRAFGMRTFGTRGATPVDLEDPDFDRIGGPESLLEFLSEADYVVVSCQWTDETTDLFDEQAFSAMKKHAVLVNVARGEIISESALIAALDTGHLRGAVLDVFVGEFEAPPPPRLWQHPKVLITPHTSAHTDESRRRSTELFCENLRRFLNDEPLENRVDWSTGY